MTVSTFGLRGRTKREGIAMKRFPGSESFFSPRELRASGSESASTSLIFVHVSCRASSKTV